MRLTSGVGVRQPKPAGSTSSDHRARRPGQRRQRSRHAGRNRCSAARRALCTTIWPRSKPARRASSAGTGENTSTSPCAASAIARPRAPRAGTRRRRRAACASAASSAACAHGGSPAASRSSSSASANCGVVVRGQRRVHRVLGKVGLHDDFAGQPRAAGAARDLHEQRGQALGRAEVGAVERVVGAEHADQREARKVVALREHLRADQDVDRVGLDLVAHARERVLARACCRDRRARCAPRETPPPARARGAACRSRAARRSTLPHEGHARGSALGVAAMMAAQRRRRAMHREPRAAARALRFPLARGADERRGEAAAVDEHQRLLAAREPRGDAPRAAARRCRRAARAARCADEAHRGQRARADRRASGRSSLR